MSGQTAVQAHELHKDFGDIYAVKDVSFQIRTGEVFSLLGPNGAGKSTTISIICGLLKPDKGDAVVFGKSILRDPLAVKSALGVVPQDIALYEDLSARENLFFWGRMYGLQGAVLRKRVDEVLEIIGLAERQKDRVGKYSGGMKRRLNVGVALLHEPEIIIMDEPTVGIDPQSRRNILDSVMSLNQQGMTVLYTTHYMEEAQELSDQIVILDQGEIIASGTHNELVKIVGELDRIDVTLNTDSVRMFDAWQAIQGVRNIDAQNGTVSLLVEDSNLVLPLLFESASQSGARITSLEVEEPNLETVFLHLTGKALRD